MRGPSIATRLPPRGRGGWGEKDKDEERRAAGGRCLTAPRDFGGVTFAGNAAPRGHRAAAVHLP
ncbi:MAG: hypothetical protein EHM77_05440 [Planctomycetaceae bacterium]|nr:MAG: hypothetical protein EHM77_05440 [Planctomycetaceae bacterium]